jgi:hypothetical protein
MRAFVAMLFLLGAFDAAAQRRPDNNNPWGAGAFNSNYRPAGSSFSYAPSWRALEPTWRGGYLHTRGQRAVTPYVAPYAYSPYGYGYGYGYPAYGSTYYGFQPSQPEAEPEPAPAPPPVVVFERPQAPAPAPAQETPAPQVIIVQVPVPAPAPAPVAAPVAPEPPQPKGPPREVYRWTDGDGVVHYSTLVPAGVKAEKVGPK